MHLKYATWPAGLVMLAGMMLLGGCSKAPRPITVGAGTSLDQTFLAEVAAQHLERRLGGKVVRRFNLGETLAAQTELLSGEIDLMAESPCDVLANILRVDLTTDGDAIWERVRTTQRQQSRLEWTRSLGYDNRFILGVRKAEAAEFGVSKLSDLSKRREGWRPVITRDFEVRRDGFALVNRHHRIALLRAPMVADSLALPRVFEQSGADLVGASAVDPIWERSDLVPLADADGVLPPCDAGFVYRADAEKIHPGLARALGELSGKFTLKIMREAGARLASGNIPPDTLATVFLREVGLAR